MDGVHYMYNFTEQLWQAVRASRLEWIFRSFRQSEWTRLGNVLGAPSDSAAAHWQTRRSVPFSFPVRRSLAIRFIVFQNQQIWKRAHLFTSYFPHEFRYMHIESIQKQLPICWCFKSPFVPSNFPFIFKRTSHCDWGFSRRSKPYIVDLQCQTHLLPHTQCDTIKHVRDILPSRFAFLASLPFSSCLFGLPPHLAVCIPASIQPLSLRLRLRLSEGISISFAPNFPPSKQNTRAQYKQQEILTAFYCQYSVLL